MGKELVKQESGITVDVQALISQGLEKNANIEVMERLFAMAKEADAIRAKREFFTALSKFQSELPEIGKDKPVKSKDGTLRYHYAPIESIVRDIKTPLKDNGFSYRFVTNPGKKVLTKIIKDEVKQYEVDALIITCIVNHVGGHSETTDFIVPIGSDYMTSQQEAGAANTYGKRYALCNGLGIVTGDEDTDANNDEKTEQPKQSTAQSTAKTEDKSASKRGDAPPFPKEEHKPSAEFALMLDRCRTMLNNLTADLPIEGKKLAFEDTCKAVFGVKKYYKPLDKFTLDELDKLYQRLNEDAAK
jgi:hypothetical protein